MLDIVYGSAGQTQPEASLRAAFAGVDLTGTLYFSYPLFDSVEGQVSADALLVTLEHGLVLFDLTAPHYGGEHVAEWVAVLEERQDEIFRNISSKLFDNKELVRRRELVLKPTVLTFFPQEPQARIPEDLLHATPETVGHIVSQLPPLTEEVERALNATIQRVTTIKPKIRRNNVGKTDSLGATVREIEKGIANLDAWQKKSAIAYPEGPQRIRGLAGSGKTIVLALKAAYLHARHPEWNIAVTYYSRALKQQFTDLVRRFMYETKKDEPDWSKIHIFHCWGSRGDPGLYSEAAKQYQVDPVSWKDADRKYGSESFDGICKELLSTINLQADPKQIYDAILIDEAQDLPVSFFRIAYSLCKHPKRIVWAYDELQNLGEYSMASPAELFGQDEHGRALVSLTNEDNRPPQDIVLPICYRNTPWALTVAHGLGFGIYRETADPNSSPLVQIFDEPELWTDIGYESVRGDLLLGEQVALKRRPECSPAYYSDPQKALITADEAVQFHTFDGVVSQAEWVATQILDNVTNGELLYRDILVIVPSAWTSKSEYAHISRALRERGLPSHLVGISSSRDEVFTDDSIAVTHIYRAKGNEAPMVYFLNSHECYAGLQLAKKRNTLFTAITRSRAWVRVCGVGQASTALTQEYQKIKDARYILDFVYPTWEQIKRMRRIHRDRSEEEQKKLNRKVSEFSEIIELIKSGEVSLDALPPDFVAELKNIVPRV
ncbi:DEAD/DEAH box helicase [Rhizobium giardinii]|uniref:DEAD/DEAH box helicase n=1 Tax=Rhizobium giardinii TaxID=56731 RepID=UPI003D6FFAC1